MKITSIDYNSKVVSFKGREDTNDVDKKTDRSFITRKLDELKSRRAIWGTMPKSDGSLFSDIKLNLNQFFSSKRNIIPLWQKASDGSFNFHLVIKRKSPLLSQKKKCPSSF